MSIRLLTQSDADRLEAFLIQHRDSSMFLRSNARRAGFDFCGNAYQAQYIAAFRAGEIVAVAAHGWTGMVLVQAPEQVAEVARACVRESSRKVPGGFDLEVERRHVCEQARLDEVVGVGARLRAMRGRPVEEACHGGDGLQEGRHAKIVE